MSARDLRGAGRLVALAATGLVLLATSVPPCIEKDRGTFDAETTCGPPGAVTLAFEDAHFGPVCAGGECWGFVEAPGAGAVGLPEQGEIHPTTTSSSSHDHDPAFTTTVPTGRTFTIFPFALVGDAPVAGASPPATVRRTCRATPSATAGVVNVACEGPAPEAACAGTLTLVPVTP